MIDYEEALKLLRSAATPVSIEQIPLLAAPGRVARQAISARCSLPSFDNSAMDGFAVRSSDTRDASATSPVTLRVAGSVAAGQLPEASALPDTTFEIFTGAPVPQGCDAVVKVEDVERTGDRIRLRAPVPSHSHVRHRGEDFREGDAAVPAGTRLDPRHVLALASLGVAQVTVSRRLRAALIATGDEIVGFETERVPPGKIRNSTSPYLRTELAAMGIEVFSADRVSDSPEMFLQAVERARTAGVDLLLTTGAVSVGRHDFIAESLRSVGAEMLFHKVAIRPGKPILAARLPGGPMVFGLPGNPLSTAVGLRFFVTPFVRALDGRAAETGLVLPLAAPVKRPKGLRCFFEARVRRDGGRAAVEVLPDLASFRVRPLLDATAWAVLPEGDGLLEAGTPVHCFPVGTSPFMEEM